MNDTFKKQTEIIFDYTNVRQIDVFVTLLLNVSDQRGLHFLTAFRDCI